MNRRRFLLGLLGAPLAVGAAVKALTPTFEDTLVSAVEENEALMLADAAREMPLELLRDGVIRLINQENEILKSLQWKEEAL